MDRKKKVLIVHNYYQIPGGEDTVVANEKKMLEEHGHDVVLYSRNNSELNHMKKASKLLLPFSVIFNIRTYRDVKRIIKDNSIDIVHVHNTLNLISPSVYYAARSLDIPVVQTVHNFRFVCPAATFYRDGDICEDCLSKGLGCAVSHRCYRGSRIQTLACVLSTKIHRMLGIYRKINYICLTKFTRDKLLNINKNRKNPVFIPDSFYIKPNFTYPNPVNHKKGDFFLFIGRIEKIKGIDLLIEAFSKLPEEKLIVAGTGTDLDRYKRLALAGGCDNIIFEGFVEREKLNNYLSEAKAVIVTSQWYETFGMIIAEAFSSHVPVITGDIGNIGGLVSDGVNGFKFTYDSPDDLVRAIEEFNSSDYMSLSDNAYAEYENRFTPEINYRTLMDIYDDICNTK